MVRAGLLFDIGGDRVALPGNARIGPRPEKDYTHYTACGSLDPR
jgi:hypothetical protein